MGSSRHLATILAVTLAGLWGLGLGILHWRGEASILDRIEAPLTDLRFLIQGQRAPPDSVTIVAIDDEVVQEAGAYPLPRTIIARLVEKIAGVRPRAIALDLLFVAPGPADGDDALAKALRDAPCVLAAAGLFSQAT